MCITFKKQKLSNEQNKNINGLYQLFEKSNDYKVYRKGHYIYQENETARGVFRVIKGRVKLWNLGTVLNKSLIFYVGVG